MTHTRIVLILLATVLSAEQASAQRFTVAGIDDDGVALHFLTQLQTALGQEDSVTIAGLVNYPLNVFENHHDDMVRSRGELLAQYRSVFLAPVRHAIMVQDPDSLFANWRGVMIGNGQVWYRPVCDQEGQTHCPLLIYTVNRDAPPVQ